MLAHYSMATYQFALKIVSKLPKRGVLSENPNLFAADKRINL
jgi:hypothetical protein